MLYLLSDSLKKADQAYLGRIDRFFSARNKVGFPLPLGAWDTCRLRYILVHARIQKIFPGGGGHLQTRGGKKYHILHKTHILENRGGGGTEPPPLDPPMLWQFPGPPYFSFVLSIFSSRTNGAKCGQTFK